MSTPVTVWESLQIQGTPVADGVVFIDPDTLQPDVDPAGLSYDQETQETGVKKLAVELEVAAGAGNSTINKMAGVAKIAAAAQEVTITNDRCEIDSLVIPFLQTDDTTAKSVIAHTIAAGSFKLKLNAAATAQVSVGFMILRSK
jgi:hypothetical protein